MKNSIIQFALISMFFLAQLTTAFGQTTLASYPSNSEDAGLDNTLAYRAKLMALALEVEGYTLVAADLTTLAEGEKFNGYRTCYAANDYTVVAVTEAGVKDLDLYIYDSGGRLVDKNLTTSDEGVTMIDFSMLRTDEIRIMAKNYKSRSKYKACLLYTSDAADDPYV